ncbi:hypothetical protein BC835DRAFT_1397479 [Cytidiella melzeri]|nr:hypothetical protein BC835DRAFT_1397479 [Cytidiella melzeri]
MFQSWWPTSATWSQSGMTLDYWSAGDEQFFVKHRENILKGAVQPKSVQEWHKALAHRKTQKTNIVNNVWYLSSRALPTPS